jgi:hypothetical protein
MASSMTSLRVKDELNPQPTIAELIIAIATYLHAPKNLLKLTLVILAFQRRLNPLSQFRCGF